MACQSVCLLRHPNIVQCLGTIRRGFTGEPFILLELMDENLTRFLQRSKQKLSGVPDYVKVNICHDIVLGLMYLHDNGIVHANLTSNNVLLAGESKAKITDFWSLDLTRETHTQLLRGSSETYRRVYMAPEAFQNPPVFTRQSDAYSFGVLLLQVNTVSSPAPDGGLVAAVQQCKRPINVGQDTPSFLAPLARQCLVDDCSQRADLGALCRDLSRMRASDFYRTSKQQSRDECDDLRRRLEECERVRRVSSQLLGRQREDISRQSVVMKDMEQALLDSSEENDRLKRKIAEQELLLLRTFHLSPLAPGKGHLLSSIHSQDEPDSSTDACGDNGFPGGFNNEIHGVMAQKYDVIVPLKDLHVQKNSLLGEGEIGAVFSATWGKKEVAFKKFKHQVDSDDWSAKLKYETKGLCQLQHPRLVAVYGTVLEVGNKGIVMEHMSTSLRWMLHVEKRALRVEKRVKLVRQIAEGLEYLHSQGVVHCNLTSKNVLLDSHNCAKITNYGPKFVRSQFSYIHDRVGKVDPNYVAPEILQNKPLPQELLKKADVYSMGVLSHEVMESQQPYPNLPSQLIELSSKRIQVSGSMFANLSQEMFGLVRRCWEQDSSRRPSSKEFLNAWRKQ